jgi:hypothetical protein
MDNNMKKFKTALFILGIILLVAGVYFQDLGISSDAVDTFNVISPSQGAINWNDFNYVRSLSVPGSVLTGLVLKLVGLGLLFVLFFIRLSVACRGEGSRTTLPALLGLGSAVCFAAFTALAPVARTITWTWEFFATNILLVLDAEGLLQLGRGVYAQAMAAVLGALILSVGFLLLAAALVVHHRGRIRLIPPTAAVPVIFILAQGRAVRTVSPFDSFFSSGAFSIVASLVPAVFLILFIWGVTVRNSRPRRNLLPTVIMTVVAGCVALIFWITTLAHLAPLRSPPQPTGRVVWGFILPLHGLHARSWSLSTLLFASALFIPILCAFMLRRLPEEPEKTETGKKPLLPLIAGAAAVAVLVIAGYLGFRQSPYKTALQEVSIQLGIEGGLCPPHVEDEQALLDSEEGMDFLLSTIRNPREFYWHRYVAYYLWNHSANPKASELLFEILSDSSRPVASAHAAGAITECLGFGGQKFAEEFVLSHISKKPGHGPVLIQAVLEYGLLPAGFVIEIMKVCAGAGIEKFTFRSKVPVFEDDNLLVVPEEFSLYYNRRYAPDAEKLVVKLLWCERDNFELSDNPRLGRTVLETEGRKFDFVMDRFDEQVPDYAELAKLLCQQNTASKRHVELHLSAFGESRHVRHVLNACARAGITEVSIIEH